MTLGDWKNIATIFGVVAAVIVYITNSVFQYRDRKLGNIKRFLDAHDHLFRDGGYIMANLKAMDIGSYKRDPKNEAMEIQFNRLLGDIERIALLTENGAISKTIQAYMFGWFAQRIQPELTSEERNNIFWHLAIKYLDEMKNAADDYGKKDGVGREEYWKKRHFAH